MIWTAKLESRTGNLYAKTGDSSRNILKVVVKLNKISFRKGFKNGIFWIPLLKVLTEYVRKK